ncbi:LysR family transcriptional regulator [Pigmentiphaga litoralis]|uniref:DNA-binding transcriptional LysR family regulator n=1 Tax=Pigmentiphaga litoralis TaxID=516702 RepID=A0A7Y9LJ13_9BURK|nr:LysR family transcriptional regulator [Pigmentiphaga litoralis]NYE24877.1 DNA-binding transcriptional LysR family regulator [Pigmentiphaga litoralis]NYE81509.1 DNA-binding transcriptional LysR family regulator [Pigmentiphaga litoralis]
MNKPASMLAHNPQLSDFAFFVLVVRKGSLSVAARELDITLSAVSKRLSRIEQGLGVRLLNRTTRRLSLTEEGSIFLDRARQILADIEEMELYFQRTRVKPSGLLRINAPMGFGRQYIAPVVSAFAKLHRDIDVQLALTDRPVGLNDDDFDIAIRFGELPDARVIARKIAPNRRLLCASPAYLNLRGRPETPQDLLDHQCIVLRQNDSGFGVWRLSKEGETHSIKVNGALSSNDGEVTLTWGLDGHGILMRAEWDIARYFRSGRLEHVLVDYELPPADIFAVYSEQNHTSPRIQAFVDFLASRFSFDQASDGAVTSLW